jgi:5-(carboxyamino)imidazole ribonucleotide synthase
MAAQTLGYRVVVLDPEAEGPAASVADGHIQADYLDEAGLSQLATLAAAATTEFENVPAAALDFLARAIAVSPSAASVAIAQDRVAEKRFLQSCGAAVAPFAVVQHETMAVDASLLPGIVKSARMGYDGKGQVRVTTIDEVAPAVRSMNNQTAVLEALLSLACEVSVIVARNEEGQTATWPVAENIHRNGILDLSIVPARVPQVLADEARNTATMIAERLDYRGVLCVEMFVTRDGALLVNEIAPRPHNSGHYTINACVTSQFEQQARVLAGLPLGSTRQHEPAVMQNLLGDIWFAGDTEAAREPEWAKLLHHPQTKLHLYGKKEARRGRKMGHVTCVAPTLEEALRTARAIRKELGLPAADAL